MILQSIKRTDPEKVFIICKNGEASAALTDGKLVVWDTTAADGVTVKFSGTGGGELICAGFVSGNDIAAGEYGTIQVYGYHGNLYGHTDLSAAAKTMISHTTAGMAAAGAAASDPGAYLGFTLAAVSSSRVKGIIRML